MMQLLFAVQCQFFVLGYESHFTDFVDLIGVNGFFFGSENDSKQMWFVRKVHKVVDRLLPLPFFAVSTTSFLFDYIPCQL